jgi:hypothetical protein
MIQHKDHAYRGAHIEITFANNRGYSFDIQREDEQQVEIIREDSPFLNHKFAVAVTLPEEFDEMQCASYILLEEPKIAKIHLSCLSDETRSYMQDNMNNEPTALINLLQRRGYEYSQQGAFLYINITE